jgi:hypothetical protein
LCAILIETELQAFFGVTGYEAFLFREIAVQIDTCSAMLWTIYSKEDTAFVFKDGLAVVETRAHSWDEEGQRASMEEMFKMYEELRKQVAILSTAMIHCIKNLNFGNIAGQQIPIPESELKSKEEQSPKKQTLLEA